MTGSAGFAHLEREVYRLYTAGAYQEALDRTLAALEMYPDQVDELYRWAACLAGRMGNVDAGIRALAHAAAAGCFYAEPLLRDPDLDPLREHPTFKRLSDLFRERLAAAQAAATARVLTRPPADTTGPLPLLLVLHGNNSSPAREAGHWEAATGWGWLLAMPQSSRVMGRRRFGWSGQEQAEPEIQEHYRGLAGRWHLDPARSVIGGMSRGGALAIQLALAGRVPARSFLAVAPALKPEAVPQLVAGCAPGEVRGYVVVGEQDYAYPAARELVAALRERGYPCQLESHPDLAHAYPDDFGASLERALGSLIPG